MSKNFFIQADETPEHLVGLAEVLNKDAYYSLVDDEEYAKAAFDLILVAQGDNAALKRVSDFIQMQQASRKRLANSFNSIRKDVTTWIGWAARWTQRKVS